MNNNRQGRGVPAWLRAAGALWNPIVILALLPILVLAIAMPISLWIANGHGPGWLYTDVVAPTATSTAVPPTATPTATPTASPTQTVAPTQTPTATPMPERIIVTYYGEKHRGGPLYCGTDVYGTFDPDDPSTVAMGANGPPCGSRLRLCSESACIFATIKDRCGGCGPGHLDLSEAGWEALGRPAAVDMTILLRGVREPKS